MGLFDNIRNRQARRKEMRVGAGLPEAQKISLPEQQTAIPARIDATGKLSPKTAPAAQSAAENLSPLQRVMSGINLPDPQANIPDKITPTGPAAQPAISDTDNMSMLDSMITRPLTPSDIERRKRAATSVAAIGQLGNLISAYSNLAGTTGGAVPQVIPGYQGPDIDSWQERARQRQMEYAQIMSGLSAQDWQQARQQALDRQAQANADREYQLKVDAAKETARQFDENQKRLKEQAAAELESLDKYRKGQVAANQTRADKYQGGGSGSRGGTPNNDTIASGDYEYTFDRREGNSATWKGLYQSIPKEWLNQLPSQEQVHYYDDNADITRKQQELIIRYAQEHPEYMEEMMNRYPSVLSRKKIEKQETEEGWWNNPSGEQNWWNN